MPNRSKIFDKTVAHKAGGGGKHLGVKTEPI